MRKTLKKLWKFEEKCGKWISCVPGTIRLTMPMNAIGDAKGSLKLHKIDAWY